MAIINSVLGPLETDDLGFTLIHEHLILAAAGVTQNYPEFLGEEFASLITAGLTQAKKGGIDTVVDCTTLELGRDVNLMARAARQTGVNIIACSGWWIEPPPYFVAGVPIKQLARVFVREIRQGIAGTDIQAGILKAASDAEGVNPWQEKVLRAVAQAHLQTGVPIMLHSCSPKRIGERQISILKEEGVDLRRVKMDHSNDTTDLHYLTWLLDQGCYLGMDRYPGKEGLTSGERTQTLKALIDAGYADRLLVSHDWALADMSMVYPAGSMPYQEEERTNPYGYLYLKKVVFPQLREMGVSEPIIDRLCTINPRNFLAGENRR
jgi:phosphotriesterase-related protein